MLNKSFADALPIVEQLEQNGFQAFFVGGSVRDALIGRSVGDVDITTSAMPDDVTRLFEKVIPVGIAHGTVIVRWHGESYEVTTFRTESGYSDYRRPDQVKFVTDVKEDLARRDFTMNAVAMDRHGNLIDPFHGKRDIKEKLIQAVGNPEHRFREDPLRMMRAVRFASQLDFYLEDRTRAAINRTGYLLQNISVERIAAEIEKLFAGKNVKRGLELIDDTGLKNSIPIWKKEPGLLKQLKKYAIPLDSMEEVLALFVLLGAETELTDWMREWKLSNRVKSNAEKLLEGFEVFQREGLSRWLVYTVPKGLMPGLCRLVAACCGFGVSYEAWEEVADRLPIKGKKELAVSGKDIMEVFPERNRGSWIKELIEKAEQEVVSGNLPNDKAAIKEWLRDGKYPQTTD